MEAKTATPADRVYVEFEPSMEWAWDDKWGTLLLYLPGVLFIFIFIFIFTVHVLWKLN